MKLTTMKPNTKTPHGLSRNGLPIDPKHWTKDDWCDLFNSTQAAIQRIAARHNGRPATINPTYYVQHPDGSYSEAIPQPA